MCQLYEKLTGILIYILGVFASYFESCLGECVPHKTSSSKKQNMFMSPQALHLKNNVLVAAIVRIS